MRVSENVGCYPLELYFKVLVIKIYSKLLAGTFGCRYASLSILNPMSKFLDFCLSNNGTQCN